MFIWYFNCLQDTLTLPTLVNITFANARIGLLRLQSFGPLWTISTGNQWEISEVGHLSCFINFCLFDFTLFMIDIHQIMLISLFPTPLDHFHFHGSGGLILWYDFRLWHMCCFYWPMLQEKHHLQLKFQKNIMKRPYEQLVIYVCGGGVFEVSSTLKTTISIILLKWVLFWVSWKTTNQEKSQIISFLVII